MSEKVFVLTTDNVEGWDCNIVRFPTPLVVTTFAANGHDALEQLFNDMQERAREIGANAVLSVRHSDKGEWWSNKNMFMVRGFGLPVYLDPPLPDPEDMIRELNKSSN